jgi:hypothetical protein
MPLKEFKAMDDNRPTNNYEEQVAARFAFEGLFKIPAQRTAAEQRALDMLLGKPKSTPETVGAR